MFFEVWALNDKRIKFQQQSNLSRNPKTERIINTCACSSFAVTGPHGILTKDMYTAFSDVRHTSAVEIERANTDQGQRSGAVRSMGGRTGRRWRRPGAEEVVLLPGNARRARTVGGTVHSVALVQCPVPVARVVLAHTLGQPSAQASRHGRWHGPRIGASLGQCTPIGGHTCGRAGAWVRRQPDNVTYERQQLRCHVCGHQSKGPERGHHGNRGQQACLGRAAARGACLHHEAMHDP